MRQLTTWTGPDAVHFLTFLRMLQLVHRLVTHGVVMEPHKIWYRCASAFMCPHGPSPLLAGRNWQRISALVVPQLYSIQDLDIFTEEQHVKMAIRGVAATLAAPRHAMNITAHSRCVPICNCVVLKKTNVSGEPVASLSCWRSAHMDALSHAANQVLCTALQWHSGRLAQDRGCTQQSAFACNKHIYHIPAAGTPRRVSGSRARPGKGRPEGIMALVALDN